ncbi:MAG TPA: hypothetical protein VEY89_04145 [Candidatus Dormibacteraeota bacterium]|nr:hypothetical protein [Candidatus Dormibacteraeota bacterium]
MHQSFVNYRSFRYAILATAATGIALLAYLIDKPRVPPNGGTWLGYTLGGLAAGLVVFLSLLGIRKRTFHSRLGTATGWLSAHVYLGIAALLLATLHSGLRFGLNVHTLAYVLMWLVTLSGAWGVYAYVRYPAMLTRQRGNMYRKTALQQIADLDERALELAALNPQVEPLVAESIRRTDLGGGGLWQQLRSRDHSVALLGGESALRPSRLIPDPGHRALIEQLAHLQLSTTAEPVRARIAALLDVAASKAALALRLRHDARLAALLRIWLYVHVPLACALLAALLVHIVSVFLYW